MSERLLRFLLQELTLVRIRCLSAACKGRVAVEVPVADLPKKYERPKCPFCNADLAIFTGDGSNAFAALAKALQDLAALDKLVAVEFVLPVEEK